MGNESRSVHIRPVPLTSCGTMVTVPSQPPSFTITEAISLLQPPITADQLRHAIAAAGVQPCGYRQTGRAGRPAPVYQWTDLLALHGALLPWLDKAC